MSTVSLPYRYLALGPLDGRYAEIAEQLAPFFSEFALVESRFEVEVLWLDFFLKNIFLKGDESSITKQIIDDYKKWHKKIAKFDFSAKAMKRIKEIESVTNHDVKAVELYIAEELDKMGLSSLKSYVHIGCTSEDITNLAYARMIKRALLQVWWPAARGLQFEIEKLIKDHSDTPMLAHTHGQPATPTTVGKEFAVYHHRFEEVLDRLDNFCFFGKFNGATGNYSAISAAFPELKPSLRHMSKVFVEEDIGVGFNPVTTQIESHDWICDLLDCLRHYNNILRNFDKDIWLYVSMDYFKQIPVATEVGSSTMPHKINPIRFENSEANTELSNALCHTLSDELALSRLQRDLTDSSSMRNIGLAFGYSLQAIEQTKKGLVKVAVNEEKLAEDLNNHWEVLAEPIQTILRKYGIPDAYDQLKKLTRGGKVTKTTIQKFVKSLPDIVSAQDVERLLNMRPETYTGMAAEIALEEIDLTD